MQKTPRKPGQPRGWYHRGRLQHFDGGVIDQFITFRLFDSVPQKLIERWKSKIDPNDPTSEAEYRKKIERFLDRGSYDRYIRNEAHLANVIRYIERNPVKARLCEKISDWEFSSAYSRERSAM